MRQEAGEADRRAAGHSGKGCVSPAVLEKDAWVGTELALEAWQELRAAAAGLVGLAQGS